MAALAFGIAGAGIGGFLGSASIGWTVGSLVGNLLFPQKQPDVVGPRLGDLKVQQSTYGGMIPLPYASIRMTGQLMWSTPKLETRNVTHQGGKGGPSQTVVNFTYSASFAVALCDKQITGVRRIWANSNLIYNVDVTADADTLVASNRASTAFRFYLGTETQEPDSIIQSFEGADVTPAYRGTAYVLFDNFQLGDYGNNIPNLEFEVVVDGEFATQIIKAYALDNSLGKEISNNSYFDGINIFRYMGQWDAFYTPPFTVNLYQQFTGGVNSLLSSYILDATVGAEPLSARTQSDINAAAYGITSHIWFVGPDVSGGIKEFAVSPAFGTRVVKVAKSGNYFVAACQDSGTPGSPIYKWDYDTGSPAGTIAAGVSGRTIYTLQIIDDTLYVLSGYFAGNLHVETYDLLSNTLLSDFDTGLLNSETPFGLSVGNDNQMYVAKSSGIYQVAPSSPPAAVLLTTLGDTSEGEFDFADFFFKSGLFFVASSTHSAPANHVAELYATTGSANTIALSDIVADLCERTGLASGDLDVTQLTDQVNGYVISSVAPARAAIEPLMQAFYFDAVESDGKVKFVKRGQDPVLTIAEDDLAAHDSASEVPDGLKLDRDQETELPVEVDITYMDKDAAYQPGTQQSRRLITQSKQILGIQLAIAMDAAKARQISDVLMYDAWTTRNKYALALTNEYAYLEPTDVIAVAKATNTYTLRLTDENAASGINSFNALSEDIQVYTQSPPAQAQKPPDDTVSSAEITGRTKLALMDIPILRDQDDAQGFYAAASGYVSGWAGAQLFKSIDGGAAYFPVGSGFNNAAAIGSANGTLGDFHGGNIFDELNTLSVTLTDPDVTLESTTELAVLNGANPCLIGTEIIQFKNATLTAPNTYALSGLLRGRRGTEWAIETHASGERFVMFSPTTTYLSSMASAEYNLERLYKAPGFGTQLANAETVRFTNTGIAQKPFSPVLLGGGRDASNNITIKWHRRTRIGGSWNGFTAPLGEVTEAYEIDVANVGSPSSVLRTIAASVENATYSAANQSTDGITPGDPIVATVYQIGSFGRGYGQSATI